MTTIENKYNNLKTKYGLPEYKELNTNFMIEDIDSETTLILPKIRIKIHEKIEYYTKIIESILQPDSTLSSITLSGTSKPLLVYSTAFFPSSVWSLLKDEVEKLIRNLSEAWKKETDIKNDSSYFG